LVENWAVTMVVRRAVTKGVQKVGRTVDDLAAP
jgi:hypothetical protein